MTMIVRKKVDYFLGNGNLNDDKFLLVVVDENFTNLLFWSLCHLVTLQREGENGHHLLKRKRTNFLDSIQNDMDLVYRCVWRNAGLSNVQII